ncbi:MAG: ATPase inhibitor subunit zeta [Parvularculaceae bacterium]|nr:ATPase inhibitor subunit zeta [Parvularculaceae bacterium]
MANFDERKDSFEKKFAHDETLKFKAGARRNKLLGQWAAGQAPEIRGRREGHRRGGKIKADLDAAGVSQTDHQIRRHMDEFMAEAIRQLQEQG